MRLPKRLTIANDIETIENAAESLHVHALTIRNAYATRHGEWTSPNEQQAYIDTMLSVLRLRALVDEHIEADS